MAGFGPPERIAHELRAAWLRGVTALARRYLVFFLLYGGVALAVNLGVAVAIGADTTLRWWQSGSPTLLLPLVFIAADTRRRLMARRRRP